MNETHRKIILNRKYLAGYHKAIRKCSVRKIIYKTEQKIYSPFVKVVCGNLVLWKKVSGKMEVGEFAYCNVCSKMEKIIEVY